eukprot:5004702-Prymnesium_polylepis.1
MLSSLHSLCASDEFKHSVEAYLFEHAPALQDDEGGEFGVIQAHAGFVALIEGKIQSLLDGAGVSWADLDAALQDNDDQSVLPAIRTALAPADDLGAFREALVASSLALEADLLQRWRQAAAERPGGQPPSRAKSSRGGAALPPRGAASSPAAGARLRASNAESRGAAGGAPPRARRASSRAGDVSPSPSSQRARPSPSRGYAAAAAHERVLARRSANSCHARRSRPTTRQTL